MWRVTNHSHRTCGARCRTLEILVRTWLFPILDYSGPLWIFSVFETISFRSSAIHGYCRLCGEVRGAYLRCARQVLGAEASCYGVSALVMLGWLPLQYHLAMRGACWYFRIHKGMCGDLLLRQCQQAVGGPCSIFHVRCREFIERLSNLVGCSLLTLDSLVEFKIQIRRAIYRELTDFWLLDDGGASVRAVFSSWSHRDFSSSVNRHCSSVYFRLF